MKSNYPLINFLRGLAVLSVVSFTNSDAAPGEVFSQTKIADGIGLLPGLTLDDTDFFGFSSTSLGDLDGDGIPDLAVGAVSDDTGGTNRGAVYILFLNGNGTVKDRTKIADGLSGLTAGTLADNDRFGESCTLLGDMDGDGVPELAVGAIGDDTGNGVKGIDISQIGAVHILFLRSDGTVKNHHKIADGVEGGLPGGTLAVADFFGSSCASLGDLDGDGIPELAVGAFGEGDMNRRKGAMYVLFLNEDGSVHTQTKIADSESGFGSLGDFDEFGVSCTVPGDLDGDGIPELVVGSDRNDTGGDNRGGVYVLFLNIDGTVRSQQLIADGNAGGLSGGTLRDDDEFGNACAASGDLDGDGISELIVGAAHDNTSFGNGTAGLDNGAVHVVFLRADGTVKTSSKIADGVGGLNNLTLDSADRFGRSCAFLGDLNGDGIPEIAVGATGDDTKNASSGAGDNNGAVHILSLGDPPLVVDTGLDEFDTPSTNGSGALSLREAIRDAKATGEFRTITFESFLGGSTITLTQGILGITNQSVAIRGPGSPVTISGGNSTKIFEISTSAFATLECLELANGLNSGGSGGISVSTSSTLVAKDVEFRNCVSSGDAGGAIASGGKVTVERCSFIDNQAEAGGAIFNFLSSGILSVVNSTFSGNVATEATDGGSGDAGGGAIFNTASGVVSIRHTTFAENEATLGVGGAILVGSGTVEVENSLYAGNTAVTGQNDSGPISLTLVSEVPLSDLAPLGDFGGKTMTRPPLAGSLAIDAGFFLPLPDTDQLGKARSDGVPDLGAVEFVPSPVVTTSVFPDNSALKASLAKKIKKLKKKAKNSKRKGQKAKAKKFKKKIKKLTKQLRAL